MDLEKLKAKVVECGFGWVPAWRALRRNACGWAIVCLAERGANRMAYFKTGCSCLCCASPRSRRRCRRQRSPRHLGLIGLIFPDAPVIHLLRHPLDVVLSVFSNHLTHGFYCSYALETAARHYVRVMELVEHYRSEMTLHYLPVRYEDIVDEQEESVRRLLEFVGAPFDPSCLDFQENRRYARTASYAQVTERLYDSSRYRYRHYLKELEPVVPLLEPMIRRLGYAVG